MAVSVEVGVVNFCEFFLWPQLTWVGLKGLCHGSPVHFV